MGVVVISGGISAGPPGAGSGVFPSSNFSDSLQLGGGGQGKSFQAAGSSVSRTVNSPSAFVAIADVGASGDVTKGDTLYFRTDGPVTLELTQDDGAGGQTVQTVDISGLFVAELNPVKPLLGLRVKGSARCTYFVSGPS